MQDWTYPVRSTRTNRIAIPADSRPGFRRWPSSRSGGRASASLAIGRAPCSRGVPPPLLLGREGQRFRAPASGAAAIRIPRENVSSGAGVRQRARFTDRDRVDDVPGQASASAVTIVPLRKNADGRPLAGSSRSTKGLMHPAARRLLLRSATGRRDGNHPVRRLLRSRACGRMRRDGRTRIRRVVHGGQRSLAERPLPARGRPSAFFAGEDIGRTERKSAQAQHPPDRDP